MNETHADISENWSLFFQQQVAMRRRFGCIWNLPLKRRHTDVVQECLKPELSVLEIGAFDRNILRKIDLSRFNVDYSSLDTDRNLPHDYRSLDEVDRSFQMIWMFEVIEHLELEDAAQTLHRINEILLPGGILILTTPNSHHPHRFREPHHRTPFKFDNLGAILEFTGFEVQALYRLHNAPFFKKIFQRILLCWLHRFLGIDFAPTLLAIARRPEHKFSEST